MVCPESVRPEASVIVPETISSVSELKDLLPLSLYFHNDIPDPGSRATVTVVNYEESLRAYLDMRNEYIQEYRMGLSPPQAATARVQMDLFFDEELAAHLAMLDDVTALLFGELKKGKSIVPPTRSIKDTPTTSQNCDGYSR